MAEKSEYNRLLARLKKAERWYNDPKVSDVEKEKFATVLNDIIMKLALMVEEFKAEGVDMPNDIILDGFH